jgi:hypothetical protein
MEVQSVVFPRTFSKDAMADFLHKEQLIPLKGIDRSQSNWWRVRITDPEKYKGYITKILPKSNIHLVIGYMNKPKKEDIMIGSGEKVYYGIRPLKKGQRHPTIKEAFDNKQIRYFGLNKVSDVYGTLPEMKRKDLLEIDKIHKMDLINAKEDFKEKVYNKIVSMEKELKNIISMVDNAKTETEYNKYKKLFEVKKKNFDNLSNSFLELNKKKPKIIKRQFDVLNKINVYDIDKEDLQSNVKRQRTKGRVTRREPLPTPEKLELDILSTNPPLTKREIKARDDAIKQEKKTITVDDGFPPIYKILNDMLTEYDVIKTGDYHFNQFIMSLKIKLDKIKFKNKKDEEIVKIMNHHLWSEPVPGNYKLILTKPIMTDVNDLATYETNIEKARQRLIDDKKQKYTDEINEELNELTRLFTNLRNKLLERLRAIDSSKKTRKIIRRQFDDSNKLNVYDIDKEDLQSNVKRQRTKEPNKKERDEEERQERMQKITDAYFNRYLRRRRREDAEEKAATKIQKLFRDFKSKKKRKQIIKALPVPEKLELDLLSSELPLTKREIKERTVAAKKIQALFRKNRTLKKAKAISEEQKKIREDQKKDLIKRYSPITETSIKNLKNDIDLLSESLVDIEIEDRQYEQYKKSGKVPPKVDKTKRTNDKLKPHLEKRKIDLSYRLELFKEILEEQKNKS